MPSQSLLFEDGAEESRGVGRRREARRFAERARAATAPRMARVAPGYWAPVEGSVPDVTICTWQRQGAGYVPVPEETHMVRVTGGVLRALGMERQMRTLKRLAQAGFVEMILVAPHTWMLNLDSWYNHLRRVAEDEEFWEEGQGRIELDRETLAGAGRLA